MRPDFLPPPVSGQPIPHGWFARLYQFLLSLIPRGDGNILVDHGPEGVRIKLNPKLLATPQGGSPPSVDGACIPNYAAGESVTIGQPYEITSPGWLIGTVHVDFPAVSGDYTATWQLNLTIDGHTYTIVLASFQSYVGHALGVDSFVSVLLPAGASFNISTTTNLSSLSHTLRAYPCL